MIGLFEKCSLNSFWNVKAFGLLIFISASLLPVFAEEKHFNPNYTSSIKPVIIASTVDGKISALNLNDGKLLWTVDHDNGPLVSSSLKELIYMQGGKPVRLVPSLHGGLFQYDGDTVDAILFDADQLLSSSFRLADNTVLVGGKESSSTGIDILSGRVLYSCSVKGCHQEQNVPESSDVLVVKRQQQTVRSIENRNGNENWNFSVGEVEMEFSQGTVAHLLQGPSDISTSSSGNAKGSHNHAKTRRFTLSEISRIKVIVPDGTVCLVTPENKHIINWKHKFDSAITSAWLMLDGKLHKLNLFDPGSVPALEKGSSTPPSSGVIYMGTYEDNMYIQASPSVQRVVAQTASFQLTTSQSLIKYSSPKFKYLPCLSKSKYLTLSSEKDSTPPDDTSLSVKKEDDKLTRLPFCPVNLKDGKSKGVYYQGDLSYYSRLQTSNRKGKDTVKPIMTNKKPPEDDESIHLYALGLYWWKELLILIVTASIFAQCLVVKFFNIFSPKIETLPETVSKEYDSAENVNPPPKYSAEREYESRFLQDFEPQECLGKGGFGIVFKARNKMDDCSYAVKRILLPSSESAREKVLREVRALAQLEHPSIVRYFNAWNEQPPPEWQKKQDESLICDLSSWSNTQFQGSYDIKSNPTSKDTSFTHIHDLAETHGFTPTESNKDSAFDMPSFGTTQGFNLLEKEPDETSDTGFGGVFVENLDESWGDSVSEGLQFKKMPGKFFQNDSSESGTTDNGLRNRTPSIPFRNYEDDSDSILFNETAASKEQRSTLNNDASNKAVKIQIEDSSHHQSPKKSSDCNKGNKTENQSKKSQLPGTMYLYIQMQLCKKESLKEWLAINQSERHKSVYVSIFSQVVNAVKYVHDRQLIHRDLKPSNVLFSPDGTVKVGDFGLVTHAGDGGNFSSHILPRYDDDTGDHHTRRVGTTMYMAPEQASGTYTGKVDIFALGLILFELVYPFGTQMERVRHLSDARSFKFPNDFLGKYPEEATLVHSMLSIDADLRPSAHEISEHSLLKE